MGGGWRVCLHHSGGPGHRLPDAHAQCPWIQVKSNMSLKGITCIHYIPVGKVKWNVSCFHRLPQSMAKDSERSELSRITFVFETRCTADCKFYFLAVRENVFFPHIHASGCVNIYELSFIFLQGYNEWNNDVVEQWKGSNRKQSYSYLIQSNSTTGFTWTFRRTEELNVVRHNHTSQISLLIDDSTTPPASKSFLKE